jgi:hypothetical protein
MATPVGMTKPVRMGTTVNQWSPGEAWVLNDALAFFNETHALDPPLALSHFALSHTARRQIEVWHAVLRLDGGLRSTAHPLAAFLIFENDIRENEFLIALEDANQAPLAMHSVSTYPGKSTTTCSTALRRFFNPDPLNKPTATPLPCAPDVAANAIYTMRRAVARQKIRSAIERHLHGAQTQLFAAIPAISDNELVTQQWIDSVQSETAQQLFPAPPPTTTPHDPTLATRLSALLRRCDALKD